MSNQAKINNTGDTSSFGPVIGCLPYMEASSRYIHTVPIRKLDTLKRIVSPSSNSALFCLIYFLLKSKIYFREDVIAAVM